MTDRTRALAARLGALAAVCYVPLLLTAPGEVAADTKAYLFLDPGRLLARAAYLWDQNTAMGTVTHQNIGYLWPMGPWFWVFDRLGMPVWVAQRLWMGTLLFLAGAGILYLGRTIGPRAPLAWTAGAFAYLLSPYVLDYVARISVLLLPWAALPWMIALTQRALRSGRWREPALFALLVATAGGVNATALVLAGLAPVLWIVFAVWVHREFDGRRALATVLRMGVLTVLTNVWWMAGLAVQSGWGLDVLRYTETVETVARSSLSSEVLRGLGYWFFYGTDKLGPWIEPGRTFTEHSWLILAGFALPTLAMAAAVVTRWRYRAFAGVMVVLGTAAAVGAYPYAHPSPLGSVFKRFAISSTAGLALRSTARAIPLVDLGLAMLLVGGLVAIGRWRPKLGTASAGAVIVLAAVGNPALWTNGFVASNLQHPEHVPSYWQQAIAYLEAKGGTTRVLEVPGSDFATYRWGNEVDPITPGLMDRPYVARELIPYDTEASADLLIALDRRLQEGVLDPAAVGPVARLMGVGDVVVRGDLEYERYRTARPAQVWSVLGRSLGFAAPVGFGPAGENKATPKLPMRDEIYLQTRGEAVRPPVAAFPVVHPLPIVRVRSADAPLLLEGDGEGVVEAGAAGLLGGDAVVLSTPALAKRPGVLQQAIDAGGRLVVTDTNRRKARRWGTVRDNAGYTERTGEQPLTVDPSDNRLPLFPDAPVTDYTTVEQRGVKRVEASAYGNPVTYTPADRPANAFDGDPATAWVVGALGPVGGQRLLVETTAPVTTDHVDVVQANQGPRHITSLGVVLDGDRVGGFAIDDRSFGPAGQRLDLGRQRTFHTLQLVVEGDNIGRRPNYADQNGVGLAEVRVAGVHLDEVVKLPSALLNAASTRNPLTILLSRLRANPQEPFAGDQERTMVRSFDLPTSRTFSLTGQVEVNTSRADDRLDALLGGRAGMVVRSSGRLAGDVAGRASAALDGSDATAWTNHFGDQTGAWIEVQAATPTIVDHLDLAVVADGDHSVPTRITVSNESGVERPVVLPAVTDGRAPGHAVHLPVRFPAISGRVLRVTVDAVRPVVTTDWFSKGPSTMPVAIAEVGLPVPPPGPRSTGGCRSDLLTIDGRPTSVQVAGLQLRLCGDAMVLAAGRHELRTAGGTTTGMDVDRLVLSSGPAPSSPLPTAASDAKVTVVHHGRTSYELRVTGAKPVWLVLGQSWSRGWKATVAGRSLGPPVLVDGYANGWLVAPGPKGVVVSVHWTPQRIVWAGIATSVLGTLLCLAILLRGLRRRRPSPSAEHPWPVLRLRPWESGAPAPWRRAVVVAVVTGVGVGLVVHPLLGVAAAVATTMALRWRYGRTVGGLAVLLLMAAGAYTAAKQQRDHLTADFGWTDFFHPAHFLAWAGLGALVIVLIVDRERRRE